MKQSNQVTDSNHVAWVDVYRGLAIFLIVVGHSWSPFAGFIYLFHVPAFFFISGLTSNFTKYRPIEFILKRAKSLLVPYLLFNLVFILFHAGSKLLGVDSLFFTPTARSQYAFITAVNGLLSFSVTEDLGGATWFLMVLFSAQILAYFLVRQKLTQRWEKFLLVLGGLLLLSHFLFTKRWPLVYNWDLVPISTFFILVAYRYGKLLEKISVKWYLPLAGLIVGILWYFNHLGTAVIDFPSRSFHSLPIVLLTSFSGILLLYFLAKTLSWRPKFSALIGFLGGNSLWILGFHFAGFKLFHLVAYWLGLLPIIAPQGLVPLPNNNYWLFISIFGIIFSLGIHWLWQQKIKKLRFSHVELMIQKFQIPLLIVVAVISNLWVLSKNNFLYADDFGYLWLSRIQTIGSFLGIIPQQMYNDRPVGQFFIYSLIQIFQVQFQLIHLVSLGVHVISVLLLFWLLKLVQNKWKLGQPYFPLVAAMIFSSWPKSVFAVQWLSASFDLVAAPLILLFLILLFHIKGKKSALLTFGSILLYGLMLRTKEVLLFVPLIPIFFGATLHSIKQLVKHRTALAITLVTSTLLMSLYAMRLAFLAYSTKFMGFAGDNPYAVSLNPISLLANLGKYVVLLLNISDSSQTFQGLPSKTWVFGISVTLILATVLALRSRQRKLLLVTVLSAILLLIPVLPLKNMAHKLYLYLPMLFIAPFVSFLFWENFPVKKIKPELAVLGFAGGLLFLNLGYRPVTAERSWWQSVGAENRQEYQVLSRLQLTANIQSVTLVNFPITSIYHFGTGDVIRYQFHRTDLNITEVDDVASSAANENTLIIKKGN